MKLAIAAFGTALVLASGASAMVGPYERAVNDPATAAALMTQGESSFDKTSTRSNSPEADWSNGAPRSVTVFEAADVDHGRHFGVNGR